jgi:hypothetical protein
MMKKTIVTIAAISMMSFNVAALHAEEPLHNSLLFQLSRVCFQIGDMICRGTSGSTISREGICRAFKEATAEDCQKLVACTGVVAALFAFMNCDNDATSRNIPWSPEATALAMTAGSASVLTVFDKMSWSDFFTKAGLSAMVLTIAAAFKHEYANAEDKAYYKRCAKILVTLIGPCVLGAGLASEPEEGRDMLTGLGAAGTLGSALAWLR